MSPLLRRAALGVALLAFGALAALYGVARPALGGEPTPAQLTRMKSSPEWRDGRFHNPQPLHNHGFDSLAGYFSRSPFVSPDAPLPVARPELASPPSSGLRVTWLGHSTTLVEIDGARILTDPIWSERAGPLPPLGPRRWSAPPLPIDELPPLDAIVISHDHYDHLDRDTIARLTDQRFLCPLGVAGHLMAFGVPEDHITELDWWDHRAVGPIDVVLTPSRHASGRKLLDFDARLWGGYALLGPRHRVYFSGDTGLFPDLHRVAELGPFDLTMIEIGQYDPAWPDWHIGPEQAVKAHRWLGGKLLLPIHWATFTLAYHGWTEPIERALAAAETSSVAIVAPEVGQSFEPNSPPKVSRWWPNSPWRRAEEAPIVSTQVE